MRNIVLLGLGLICVACAAPAQVIEEGDPVTVCTEGDMRPECRPDNGDTPVPVEEEVEDPDTTVPEQDTDTAADDASAAICYYEEDGTPVTIGIVSAACAVHFEDDPEGLQTCIEENCGG